MSQTLLKAPLTLVLTRVEFNAELTALSAEGWPKLDSVMQSIGFPAANTVNDATIQLTPAGPVQVSQGSRRVYQDANGGLRVSVAPQFIALYAGRVNDVIAYENHEAFLSKFREIITALMPIVGEMPVTRTGYRYVDQLIGEDFTQVDKLLRPACRGVLPSEVPQGAQLLASALRAQFAYTNSDNVQPDVLQMQSGQIPKGQPIDPGVPVLDQDSWVLDIDTSAFAPVAFTADVVIATASRLQQRAREFFENTAVTDEFERRFR